VDKAIKKVPPLRLDKEFDQIEAEVLQEVTKVLKGGHYILGPNVEAFEKEFSAWNSSTFALGTASGTDSLLQQWPSGHSEQAFQVSSLASKS